MITIFGAAIGAFLANNQMKVVKAPSSGLGHVLQGQQVQQGALHGAAGAALRHPAEGAQGRPDVHREGRRGPAQLPLFQKYPNVGNDHHVTEFITDYLRMMVSGNLNAHEIESLMDSEIDTHHQEAHARWRPAALAGACRPSASWRPCWAWSTPWARSASRRRCWAA
jgi:chemotaxis protein MotA